MKALLLAAGRGNRLRPLTDKTPKPLLPVKSSRLCDWNLAACLRAGITDVVMNTAYLSEAFNPIPKEYKAKGLNITLSVEGTKAEDALETLGGIAKALPLLTDGEEPFLVLAGDIAHNFDLTRFLAKREEILSRRTDAYLVAVPNPAYHAAGDMSLAEDGTVVPGAGPYTYGSLMIVTPKIFSNVKPVRAKLFPWLWQFHVRAELHPGFWSNVGDIHEYEMLTENAEAFRYAKFP